MTKTRVFFLMLFLLVPGLAFAQKSGSNGAAANASWRSFYATLLTAVKRRDTKTMRQVMPDDFYDGGGGGTAGEWLKFINGNAQQSAWRDLQKSFSQGTVINKNWRSKGTPTRVTKDSRYYFEFRKDKKWYFAGVVGD